MVIINGLVDATSKDDISIISAPKRIDIYLVLNTYYSKAKTFYSQFSILSSHF